MNALLSSWNIFRIAVNNICVIRCLRKVPDIFVEVLLFVLSLTYMHF